VTSGFSHKVNKVIELLGAVICG